VRILHVVPTYVPAWRHGGPVLAVHGLCRALAARGHQVTVFTTNVHGSGTLDVPVGRPVGVDGVEVRYFPVRPPRRLYRSPAMKRALRREVAGFDLVHLHSVFLWPTFAAARAAERAGVPWVLAPRGMLVGDLLRRRGRMRKRLWILLVERRTLARAAALHATSELEAREAAALGLSLPPVHVVPNGADAEPPAALGSTPEPLSPAVGTALQLPNLLLFLGRVSWKKGLDRLVLALRHAPAANLAIAGNDEEGHLATIERLAAEAGVRRRVLALGPVHGADKAALLHAAAALVLPSYSENFGNVVLEAMAAGCPVVVTPEVGLAAAVRESGAGIVVDGEPALLGAALSELLADPARRQDMGRRGAAAVAARFSWSVVAASMESVYLGILAGRAGPAGGTGTAGRAGEAAAAAGAP
jgi:glycosyltransferase involved in cell wall biosynthesis